MPSWASAISVSSTWTSRSADRFLIDHDLVSAFERGWAVLHEEVGMFAAGQLLIALSNLECSDADIQEGLNALSIELTRERDAGTPWQARHALDVIGMLDMPAWASVMGLLDECPVMPVGVDRYARPARGCGECDRVRVHLHAQSGRPGPRIHGAVSRHPAGLTPAAAQYGVSPFTNPKPVGAA